MQGKQEEETESQQPRVRHPSRPGGGSRNPEENRKSTTKSRSPWKENPGTPGENKKSTTKSRSPWKENPGTPGENKKSTTKSRSPWKENPGTPGKQKVNNKKSQPPLKAIYLSIYLTVYLSISLSIKEPMGTWKNGTSTTKSPSRNLNALTEPQRNPKATLSRA